MQKFLFVLFLIFLLIYKKLFVLKFATRARRSKRKSLTPTQAVS